MSGFSSSTQAMSLVAFTAVATIILLLCVMTGPDGDDLDEFYTGYGSLSPMRNGLAIAGDYISAATVLSTGGVIALDGYDGVVLALSIALSLMLLMFLLAEPLRNAGRFTMGDVLARRMPGRKVRIAACGATIAALLPMMLIQLAGTGDLLAFILGFSSDSLKTGCIVGIGALMITYAVIGGMKGTALIQVLKIVMLFGSGAVVAALILRQFDWDLGKLFSAAAAHSGVGLALPALRSPVRRWPQPPARHDQLGAHRHPRRRLPAARHHAHVHRDQCPSGAPVDVLGCVVRRTVHADLHGRQHRGNGADRAHDDRRCRPDGQDRVSAGLTGRARNECFDVRNVPVHHGHNGAFPHPARIGRQHDPGLCQHPRARPARAP